MSKRYLEIRCCAFHLTQSHFQFHHFSVFFFYKRFRRLLSAAHDPVRGEATAIAFRSSDTDPLSIQFIFRIFAIKYPDKGIFRKYFSYLLYATSITIMIAKNDSYRNLYAGNKIEEMFHFLFFPVIHIPTDNEQIRSIIHTIKEILLERILVNVDVTYSCDSKERFHTL